MKDFDRLLKGKKLILFGASTLGARTVILELEGYDIAYFCDNDSSKWGKIFMGVPVNGPRALIDEDPSKIAVIITSMFRKEISDQLIRFFGIYAYDDSIFTERLTILPDRYKDLSLHKAELDKVYSLLSNDESKKKFNMILENYKNLNPYFGNVQSKRKMYFNDILSDSMCEDEVYIDAGAFNEDTIIDFIQFANNKYKKIYAFEPAPDRYEYLLDKFRNVSSKISIIHAALSDYNGPAYFTFSAEEQAHHLSPEGNCKVKSLRLDDAIEDRVTFIKMDIEGAEYEALIGAQNIIKNCKPKLAISLYHKDDDLWKLPLLIHEMVPAYKFFIEHHRDYWCETVLYAKI